MRAIVIDRFGGASELRIAERPKPAPAEGQVLIRMAYASINPADWKARAGLLKSVAARYAFPITIGLDGSGVIEALGDGVSDLAVGDRVITLSGFGIGPQGTYADYCVAPAGRTFALPPRLSLAEGATIPIAGASAASSIIDAARVRAGQRVLVNGGSGAVGNFAVQLLRHLGARVAATCATRNVGRVATLGAERVIDYTRDDILHEVRDWAPEGVDAVIDAVGLGSLPPATPDVIRRGGVLVAIQNLLTGTDAFDLAAAAARDVRVVDNVLAARTPEPVDFQVAAFRRLLAAVAAGDVAPPPFEIVPMEQAGAGQARVEQGHVGGKILIEIGGEATSGNGEGE